MNVSKISDAGLIALIARLRGVRDDCLTAWLEQPQCEALRRLVHEAHGTLVLLISAREGHPLGVSFAARNPSRRARARSSQKGRPSVWADPSALNWQTYSSPPLAKPWQLVPGPSSWTTPALANSPTPPSVAKPLAIWPQF